MGTDYKKHLNNKIVKHSETDPSYSSDGPTVFGTAGASDGGVNLSSGENKIAMVAGLPYRIQFKDTIFDKTIGNHHSMYQKKNPSYYSVLVILS